MTVNGKTEYRGNSYTYDAWGNLQITPMSGKAHGGNFTLSATALNQPTGLGYDAAGNLMAYGSASYSYDPDNRLLSTAGISYTYDGNGERALESQTVGGAAIKRYWYKTPTLESLHCFMVESWVKDSDTIAQARNSQWRIPQSACIFNVGSVHI